MAQEASWDDVKGGQSKFDQLVIAVGENKIRIMRKSPFFFHDHWLELPTGVRRLFCSGETCLICKAGYQPSKRFYIPVWDYKTESIKILESGPQIFNQLKNFAKDPDYGDLMQYDVKINREGMGQNTKYTIVPTPNKKEPTKAMLAAVETLGDISEYAVETPLDEQRVFLNMMNGGNGKSETPSKGSDDDFFNSP